MRIAALVVGLTLWLGVGEARAQFICANFWPQTSGTYGDQLMVTVTGNTATATRNGITGLLLGGNAGTTCTSYTLSQNVARFDFEVVDVDPGEEVWFDINGVEYTLGSGNLIMNPYVTAQALMIQSGRLRSAGNDGSAIAEITAFNMTGLRMCASSGDGVVVSPIINSFCQCANGNAHVNEECDDGDVMSGDGCSSTCAVEPGWSCAGNPSVCVMGCGNGMRAGSEECDDGDLMFGDGCNSVCEIEGGWMCSGVTPDVCEPVCGDAQLRGMEACDDGNMMSGDGCNGCEVEPGWSCTGAGPGSCTMLPPVDAAVDAPIDAPVDAAVDAPIDAPIDAPPIDAPPIDAPPIDAPDPIDAAVDATPVDATDFPDAPTDGATDAGMDAVDPPGADPEGCCSTGTDGPNWIALLLALAVLLRVKRSDRRR